MQFSANDRVRPSSTAALSRRASWTEAAPWSTASGACCAAEGDALADRLPRRAWANARSCTPAAPPCNRRDTSPIWRSLRAQLEFTARRSRGSRLPREGGRSGSAPPCSSRSQRWFGRPRDRRGGEAVARRGARVCAVEHTGRRLGGRFRGAMGRGLRVEAYAGSSDPEPQRSTARSRVGTAGFAARIRGRSGTGS